MSKGPTHHGEQRNVPFSEVISPRPIAKLRHLRLVALVADGRTVSEAAELGGMSQSAATQAIQKVESILKQKLFIRSPFGLKKNDAAEIVRHRSSRADSFLREAIAHLLQEAEPGRIERSLARLSLNHIEALLMLDGAQTLSDAAAALGTSRAAVYRVIAEIEDLFGGHVFVRGPRGIQLTKAGVAAAPGLRLALKEIQEMGFDLGVLQGAIGGIIRIGASVSANARLVPMTIAAAIESLPLLTYAVEVGDSDKILEQLTRGIVDIVLCSSVGKQSGQFSTVELFENRIKVVCRAWHPLVGKSVVTEADLASYPWILPTVGSKSLQRFNEIFDSVGIARPVGVIQTDTFDLIRGLLASSNCLALVSENRIAFEGHVSSLAQLTFPVPGEASKFLLVSRSNWLPTRGQTEFVSLMRKLAANRLSRK